MALRHEELSDAASHVDHAEPGRSEVKHDVFRAGEVQGDLEFTEW